MTAAAPEKLTAFIIDSDSHTRNRLKEATRPVYQFGEVTQYSRLDEALSGLELGRRCSIAFLAAHYEEEAVRDFVQKAKQHKAGQDTAFVLLVRGEKQDKSNIAHGVLHGLDGFLFEPYSVDALSAIAQLAIRVKRDRATERERLAMSLLVSDVMRQIDLVSYLLSCELEPTSSLKRLRDMCQEFTQLRDEQKGLYYEVIIKQFGEAPLPAVSFQAQQYKGASLRVKKKMAEKLVAEVEALHSQPRK